MAVPLLSPKGRGAQSNVSGRFESLVRESFDDGWTEEDIHPPPLRTQVTPERSKTIIARNTSPDVGFDRSISPTEAANTAASTGTVTHPLRKRLDPG
jgi:hypothetical protein